MIYDGIEALIGNTPLVRLTRLTGSSRIYGKLESLNPSGSAKDRAALYMINGFEARGELKPGGTIIEPTSGNTGIGLAAIGAARGYKVILVMPDTMSAERIRLLTAYGAEVVLTPGSEGMKGSIAKANALKAQLPGAIIGGQFENPDNPQSHFETTGPELYSALNGEIGAFVAGAGTGGTLSGTARFLKSKLPEVKIVAVEPESSPLLSKGYAGSHGLQGIGANFIPENLDMSLVDEVLAVSDKNAFDTARALARKEGLLCGITSGAALWAAMELARRMPDKNIVALLPDNGDRYLSTGIYD